MGLGLLGVDSGGQTQSGQTRGRQGDQPPSSGLRKERWVVEGEAGGGGVPAEVAFRGLCERNCPLHVRGKLDGSGLCGVRRP